MGESSYGLSDIVDDYCAVGVAVVHGSKRLVALLACGIPNLKFDRGLVVDRNRLSEEGGTDG